MTRQALLTKLGAILNSAAQAHTWGQIEIELRDGEATLLRKTETERLDYRGGTHEQQQTFRR